MPAVQLPLVNIQVASVQLPATQMQPIVGSMADNPHPPPQAPEQRVAREDGTRPRIRKIEQMMREETLSRFALKREECILVDEAIRELRGGLASVLEFCTSMYEESDPPIRIEFKFRSIKVLVFLTLSLFLLAIGLFMYDVDLNFFDLMVMARNVQELVHLLIRCMEVIEHMEFLLETSHWRDRLRATKASLENEESSMMAEKRKHGRNVAVEVLMVNSKMREGDFHRTGIWERSGALRMLTNAIPLVVDMGDAEGWIDRRSHLIEVQTLIRAQCVDWDLHNHWQTFASYWPPTNVSVVPYQRDGSSETYSSGSCCC